MIATRQTPVFPAVLEGFRELGASDLGSISRSILLRDGFFAGQKFFCGDMVAIVPVGGEEVAFFGRDGGLRKAVRLREAFEMELRKAA